MVESSYNSQGLVTAADSGYWTSYASQLKYDETGRMLEWTLGNGVKTSYSYNAWDTQGGRLQSTSSITNLTPATTWQHLAYSYDANGNLTTIQDFVASETLNYSYDVLDRLTGVSGAYSQSYGYNATTGNLENKAGQTLAYADINHPHAATGMGSNAYSYDENGSMVSRQISSGTYTLSYDAGGQLAGISGGGMSAAYTYNGDGERVKVAITMSGDTKTSAYIGDYFEVSVGDPIQAQTVTPPNCSISICLYLPLVMTASRAIPAGHAWTSYYSVNGRRVAMRVQSNQDGVAEGVYYFLSDHLGSTAVTLDHSGNLVGELRYSAWGETRYTSGTTPTQRRYTGQLQAEAGLYFYNARWFDGSLGRFVQADSIIPQMANAQSWDRFAYVNNSPLMYTDPSGHQAWDGCSGENGGCAGGSNYKDYVFNYLHTDQERQENQEDLEKAVDTVTTIIGVVNEPADWMMTAAYCAAGECSPWVLVGLLPFVPGSAGRKLDEVIGLIPIPKGGIYTLTNPLGKVVRVGHTKNLVSRAGNYRRDKNYFDLMFNVVYRTDDYATRRGLEQMLYDLYKPPLNANRPIRIGNINTTSYLDAATTFLNNLVGIK